MGIALVLTWELTGVRSNHIRLKMTFWTFALSEGFLAGIRMLSKSESVYVYTSYVAPLLQILLLTLVGHLERHSVVPLRPRDPITPLLRWLARRRARREVAEEAAAAAAASGSAAAAAAAAAATQQQMAKAAVPSSSKPDDPPKGEEQQSNPSTAQQQQSEIKAEQEGSSNQQQRRRDLGGDPFELALEDVLAGGLLAWGR